MVLAIFSFLESELNQLCKILSESINLPIQLKDLHGTGIDRAKLFLWKLAGFDFSKMGHELPCIRNTQMLRNQIVHNRYILSNSEDHNLNKFVASNTSLRGSSGERVSVEAEFVEEFTNVLICFYEKLALDVREFMNRIDE